MPQLHVCETHNPYIYSNSEMIWILKESDVKAHFQNLKI